jgi:hypothetical protein
MYAYFLQNMELIHNNRQLKLDAVLVYVYISPVFSQNKKVNLMNILYQRDTHEKLQAVSNATNQIQNQAHTKYVDKN